MRHWICGNGSMTEGKRFMAKATAKATTRPTSKSKSNAKVAPKPSEPLTPLLEGGTKIFVGMSDKPEALTLSLANRHGLVTGATGTGKTVTLQVLAEGFSRAGVPVFAADIKGDLSGLAAAGEAKE